MKKIKKPSPTNMSLIKRLEKIERQLTAADKRTDYVVSSLELIYERERSIKTLLTTTAGEIQSSILLEIREHRWFARLKRKLKIKA